MYRYVTPTEPDKYTERFAPTDKGNTAHIKTHPETTQQDDEHEMNTTQNEYDIPKFKFDLEQNKHIKTIRKELDLDPVESSYLMNLLYDIPMDNN